MKKEKYSPYILLKYLSSDLGKLVLDSVTTGTGVRTINTSKIETIEIPNCEIEKFLKLGGGNKAATLDYQIKLMKQIKILMQRKKKLLNNYILRSLAMQMDSGYVIILLQGNM